MCSILEPTCCHLTMMMTVRVNGQNSGGSSETSGYAGQDFLFHALVIVYSAISNLRQVQTTFQLIPVNIHLHMNADK